MIRKHLHLHRKIPITTAPALGLKLEFILHRQTSTLLAYLRGGDRPEIRGALASNKEVDLTNRVGVGTPHHLPMTLTALRVYRVSGKLHRQGLALRATGDISANEGLWYVLLRHLAGSWPACGFGMLGRGWAVECPV